MTTKVFFGSACLFAISCLFAVFCLLLFSAFLLFYKKTVWIYIYKLSFGHSQVLNQLQWLITEAEERAHLQWLADESGSKGGGRSGSGRGEAVGVGRCGGACNSGGGGSEREIEGVG